MIRKTVWTLISLIGCTQVLLAGAPKVESVTAKSFAVRPGGRLHVKTDLGSVEVRSASVDRVDVKVVREVRTSDRKKAQQIFDDFKLSIEKRDNDVSIDADYKRPWTLLNLFDETSLKVRFVITVPVRYSAAISTGGGNVLISDLTGEVRASTSGGNVQVGRIEGQVHVSTSGGDIQVVQSSGNVEAKTSGGDIRLGLVAGSSDARTSGGAVEIDEARGNVVAKSSGGNISVKDARGSVDASTSGGGVSARFSAQPKSDSRLATSGGNVVVSLVQTLSVNVDAKTSGGSVRSELPIVMTGETRSSSLEGRLNAGGPKLVLRSSGGDITLQRIAK